MAALSDKVIFWYGCNAVRHGDIIHGAIDLLSAVGVDANPVGNAHHIDQILAGRAVFLGVVILPVLHEQANDVVSLLLE